MFLENQKNKQGSNWVIDKQIVLNFFNLTVQLKNGMLIHEFGRAN